MTVDTKCKFCGCVLHLQIDYAYAATNDFLKLVKLAACNHCSDLRESRRNLHHAFVEVCARLIANKDSETVKECMEIIERLSKRYVKLISDWTGQQLVWEEEMVRPFIAAPKYLGAHLKRLWGLTKQQRLLV